MTQEEQIQKSLDEITKQTADLMGRVQTEGVTHGGQFIIPPTKQYTPDLSQVDGAIAREKEYTALLESKQSEYEQLAKQREEELKQAETEQKSVLDRMKDLVGMAKPAEVREERLTDLGYDSAKFLAEQRADISEMEALRIDYDKAVAMRDQQIADIHGTAGIGMDFLNNAIAQINRNANVVLSQKASAINNKAAIMEMKQGNFNQAISLADQAVEDFLYEIKFEYDMYHMFNQQNEDRINYLRGELKESLQTAEQYALAQYEEAREEQMQVKNLMLQYPASGIKVGDTLDEATEKATRWAAAQPVATTYKAPTVKNFGTTATPDWRQFNTATGQWEQVSGVAGAIDTRRYIQDPNNPYASIPNPNYGKPIGTAEEEPEGIPAPPDYIDSFSQYRDAGWTREQVENSWISQYNEGKPIALVVKSKEDMYKKFPEIKSALDEVFGKEPGIVGKAWDFTKKQYQKGIDFWLDIWK